MFCALMRNMHNDAKKTSDFQRAELCVYAVMPFADCYCRTITSSSIPNIAKYCMEGNSNCPVYEKIAGINLNKSLH